VYEDTTNRSILADHDGSREDFDEAVDAVIDLVPTEGIIEEATEHLGP
jgi:hypothetical protein